ncbi:hypothetical protein [Pseudomonas putida]|uniref:hypothetical protein n=1 Tax=Pseudomonas putida TaxID=303 RepID=UPI0018D932B0|nr:hypothetical protein [Pseudomonas putida]MBH3409858.1 hypothetical protein [Pseudomonas putida]
MNVKLDREEVLREISSLISAMIFSGVSREDTAAAYKARCEEYGLLMGRISAVLLTDKIDTSLLFSISNLVSQTQQRALESMEMLIRPGGTISDILTDEAAKPSA